MSNILWKLKILLYNIEFNLIVKNSDGLNKYMKLNLKYGLTNNNGSPKRCYCGCNNFVQYNWYYDERGLVEYTVRCKRCGKDVGNWAYGYWDL